MAIKQAKTLTNSARKKLKAPGSDGEDRLEIEDPKQVKIEKKGARDREVSKGDLPRCADIDPGTDQWDRLERECHWNDLKTLISSDPVLKILCPKLIGSLGGPVTAPTRVTRKIDAIRSIMHLLKEAGFCPGAFEARKLMDRDLDLIVNATHELFEKLAHW